MGKLAGRILIAVGLLHVTLFLWWGRRVLRAIVTEGFWDTIDPHRDRQMIFWSLFAGVMLVLLGQLALWAERRGLRLPAVLGWELLVITIAGGVLMPVSGGWLLAVPATLVILGARRASSAARET